MAKTFLSFANSIAGLGSTQWSIWIELVSFVGTTVVSREIDIGLFSACSSGACACESCGDCAVNVTDDIGLVV